MPEAKGQRSAVTRNIKDSNPQLDSVERAMRVIGGKWKGSILWHLKDGPVRFNDLARLLGGATRKMVNDRLKQLEAEGLVSRHVLSTRPIAVAYAITDYGRTALPVLAKVREWAERNGI